MITLALCLVSFLAGGAAYHRAKIMLRPDPIGPESFAALLEKSAHKFLVHANHAHIGDGVSYCGDLEYAKKLMAEAARIRQADEEGHGFLKLTDGRHG